MELILRLERPGDWRAVEELTRQAFWKEERIAELGTGCDEHYLARSLRSSQDFVPELDYVAETGGEIVGNIMFCRGHILQPDGRRRPVVSFGPLSVRPDWQKRGVGSALMRRTLEEAARLGHGAVFLFGHPTYYPRFGFREGAEFGVTTSKGESFPAFMAMELIPGYLDGVTGSFQECELYQVDAEAAAAFDRAFCAGANS